MRVASETQAEATFSKKTMEAPCTALYGVATSAKRDWRRVAARQMVAHG